MYVAQALNRVLCEHIFVRRGGAALARPDPVRYRATQHTHAHAGLLCAAARAVDDGLRRESDPAQLRAYLPPAQRIARLLTWVGYVSALRSMPALSTTATKRLRLAPGRVPAAEQAASSASAEAVAKMVAPLRWKLWRSDDTARAYDMTLDASTGLPSTPCVWCLLPAR